MCNSGMYFWKIVLFLRKNLANKLFDEQKSNMLLLFKLKELKDKWIVLTDCLVMDSFLK